MRLTGKTVKFVRTAVGMEQSGLAKAVGISTSHVSSIERGERNLLPEMERKIIKAFNINEALIERLLDVYGEVQQHIR